MTKNNKKYGSFLDTQDNIKFSIAGSADYRWNFCCVFGSHGASLMTWNIIGIVASLLFYFLSDNPVTTSVLYIFCGTNGASLLFCTIHYICFYIRKIDDKTKQTNNLSYGHMLVVLCWIVFIISLSSCVLSGVKYKIGTNYIICLSLYHVFIMLTSVTMLFVANWLKIKYRSIYYGEYQAWRMEHNK